MSNTRKGSTRRPRNTKKRVGRTKPVRAKKATVKKQPKKARRRGTGKRTRRRKRGASGRGRGTGRGSRGRRELPPGVQEELSVFSRLRTMGEEAREREEQERRGRRWNLGDSEKHTVSEMLAMLTLEDKKKEFNKTYKHKDAAAQKRFLDAALYMQQANDDELQRYRDETERYMVHEPGMMPYDSRLTYVTRHDEASESRPKVARINYFDINSKLASDRMKGEWQRNWARTVFDINNAVNNPRVDQGFLKKKKEQYDKDLLEFVRTDPEFLAAKKRELEQGEERTQQSRERTKMDKEEEDGLEFIRDEKNAKYKEWKEKEKELRKDEEQEYGDDDTITWAGVKRRGLDIFEDDKSGNIMATVLDLQMNDHPEHGWPAEVLLLTPQEVYEAYSEFTDKYPKSNVDKTPTSPSAAEALKRVKSRVLKSWAEKKQLRKSASRSAPGQFHVPLFGKTAWVVDEAVPSSPAKTERMKNKEERLKREKDGRGDMITDTLKMIKRRDYAKSPQPRDDMSVDMFF